MASGLEKVGSIPEEAIGMSVPEKDPEREGSPERCPSDSGSSEDGKFSTAGSDALSDDLTRSLIAKIEERQSLLAGWRKMPQTPSLDNLHSSVRVPDKSAPWYKKLAAFSGLGFVISVGYMDPGNWATGVAAGSAFGYTLLFVVLTSSILAMFLQGLALKLGVVAERDLAQACHDAFNPIPNFFLWITAEIAIAACDLAEVIGSATALYLLFGLPLWIGCLITALDVMIILALGGRKVRILEVFIVVLCALILGCMIYELVVSNPDWALVGRGLLPSGTIFTSTAALYAAIGILGATVMPHNLYLHSSLIQTRDYDRTKSGKKLACRYGSIDSNMALSVAFFVNASIVILSAAAFHYGPYAGAEVADISQAYELISPAVGQEAARILFGVALLASGQNSTITGTLAGQIVMEGFLHIKLPPWLRRMITRGVALVPAVTVAAISGPQGTGKLLVLSQVILSLQLPFAVGPLVWFTSSRARMGKLVNNWVTTIVATLAFLLITGLNTYLVVSAIINGSLNGKE